MKIKIIVERLFMSTRGIFGNENVSCREILYLEFPYNFVVIIK
jgi:hypothetical protein